VQTEERQSQERQSEERQWVGGAVIRASAFHLWERGFDSRYGHGWKESVNALPKVFSECSGFLPHGECWQVRLG
jgi:hypothetical protein